STQTHIMHDPTTPTTSTLSLHDALPIYSCHGDASTRNSTAARRSAPAASASGRPRCGRAPGGAPAPRRSRNDISPSKNRKRSPRSEEHTSELQSRENLVCRLLLEKKNHP